MVTDCLLDECPYVKVHMPKGFGKFPGVYCNYPDYFDIYIYPEFTNMGTYIMVTYPIPERCPRRNEHT